MATAQVVLPASTDPKRSAARARLVSVDVLRGLAAFGVLIYHVQHLGKDDLAALSPRYYAFLPIELCSMGVMLFIVISGFCIHMAVARSLARGEGVKADWGKFWRRRIYRLYPPYLAALALSLLIYYAVGPNDRSVYERITSLPWDLATHLLMIHNLFRDYIFGAGDGDFWSLGLEEQLYALYALFLIFHRRLSCIRAVYVVAAVTLAWKLGVHVVTHHAGTRAADFTVGWGPFVLGNWADGWAFSYWFAWVIGAVAAEAYTGALVLPRWCYQYRSLWALVATWLLLDWRVLHRVLESSWLAALLGGDRLPRALYPLELLAEPVFALACFVLINCWVRAEGQGQFQGWPARRLAALGLMSYSLYLTHTPVLRLGENLLDLDDSLGSVVIRYAVLVPVCLAFAVVFFLVIERRFLNPPKPKTGPKAVG
jgi:peptidoglycan/LPS O-acetylase OafA/YrhL